MTPTWSLLARLDGLIARLEQTLKAISTEGHDARLQKRIGNDLKDRLSAHTEALRDRRRKVASAGKVPDNAWAEVRSSTSADLLDECLLYLQTARSRGPDVAADLCEIIDALFEELAKKAKSVAWMSFSAFAPEDSFDVLTQIIRVRYPVSGVWDIPVAVHEFGHFLSGHLQHVGGNGSSLVFEEYKNSFTPPQVMEQMRPEGGLEVGGPQGPGRGIDWRTRLDEIFADVFATYAAGPSFACSCLLFRFDPRGAQDEADGKHPSYAKRAHVILQTLRIRNNEQPGRGKLARAIQLLEKSWRAACEAAGTSPDVPESDQSWIDGQVANFYDMLKNDEGGLRFNDWEAATNKLSWLESSIEPSGEFSIVELLNAAWMCRLKENSNPDQLSENFVKLARKKTESYDR